MRIAVNSFNKHLVSTYYLPDTLLGAGDIGWLALCFFLVGAEV